MELHDTCDRCYRTFSYQKGLPAICMICGWENTRSSVGSQSAQPETAMAAPARERAVRPSPKPRRRRSVA